MPGADIETCANCGRSIGRMEQAYLWMDQPVCRECYDRLKANSSSDAIPKAVIVESPRLCPRCNGPMAERYMVFDQLVCKTCYDSLQSIESAGKLNIQKEQEENYPQCPLCRGAMTKSKVHRGSTLAQGILLLIIGIALCFTGIGIIVGIPCIIVSLFMGGRNQPVWRCEECNHIVERKASGCLFIVLSPIIIACALLFSGCSSSPLYTVTRVVDGDTIEVEDGGGIRTRIRFRDVNAPELDEPGGIEAAEKLEHLLEGKRVSVDPKAKDKYGRTIAIVFFEGRNVSEWIEK